MGYIGLLAVYLVESFGTVAWMALGAERVSAASMVLAGSLSAMPGLAYGAFRYSSGLLGADDGFSPDE